MDPCPDTIGQTLKASDTLGHQPAARPVPYACAQPYHPDKGSGTCVL